MFLYEISAFVLMKTAASYSFLKIYKKEAESVLKFFFTKSVSNWGIILKWIFKNWDEEA
jgi:hypothetical protein